MSGAFIKQFLIDQAKAHGPYLKKLAMQKASAFAKKNFPKLVKKTSNLLEKKLGKKNKDLAVKAGKILAKKALASGKIQSFAEKNKNINFLTKELYDELFTNRNVIEAGLRQLDGKRRIRRRRRRRRKQTGGSIYWDDSDYLSLTRKPLRDLGIQDIRYNTLGY